MSFLTRSNGGCFEVTPHNTNALAQRTVGIYVGGLGDLKVTDQQGHTATFKAVPQGTIIPGDFLIVFNTGTTATLLVALTGA